MATESEEKQPLPESCPCLDRAVVIATSASTDGEFAVDRPACLMPLADKPALQHALETAVRCGARTVDVVMSDGADQIADFVGDGSRWGIEVQTHLTSDDKRPYGAVDRMFGKEECTGQNVLLIHADTLPGGLTDHAATSNQPVRVFCHEANWTGAAILTTEAGRTLQFGSSTREQVGKKLVDAASESGRVIETRKPLSVTAGRAILESQERVLSGEFPEFVELLRTAEPGLWIGRNTRLHPTVRLTAPVLIGSDCDIGRNVDLGPNVVVGSGSIVDQSVTASHSLVLPWSGLGQGLELDSVIISGTSLYNVRLRAAIGIRDEVLVGDLSTRTLRDAIHSCVSRLAGLILMLLLYPLLGAAIGLSKLRGREFRSRRYSIVQTPAPDNERLWQSCSVRRLASGTKSLRSCGVMWRDLLLRVVPGLSAVVRGRLRLTGITPRTRESFRAIPSHWRPVLLQAQSGLISESLVQYGPDNCSEESMTADMWYAASIGRGKRVMLLGRYLAALFCGPFAGRHRSNVETNNGPSGRSDADADADSSSDSGQNNLAEVLDVTSI